MVDQINQEKLERAVQFFSFKTPKEWAKSRNIDPSMDSEMINSLYRTEMQNMDKILAEQLGLLLQAGDILTVADIIAKAKGPIVKTLAGVLQDPLHAPLLDPLMNKYQAADYSGRKEILAACERIGGCSQLEALSQIEASYISRKKKAKTDEELTRITKKVIEKIIETDDILKVVKNTAPSLQIIQDLPVEDIHPRLMQLPLDEMLQWLLVIKEDKSLRDSSRAFALSQIDPPKSTKKTKLSKTLVRYCTAVLAIMGSNGKEKTVVNSLCKLDRLEQQSLLNYVSEKTRNDTINKLLGSSAGKEDGIWHLEQDPSRVATYKVKVFKIFEESSLPLKIRSGLLLLNTGVIPAGRIGEYVKRIALYLELSEHWEGRAEQYIQFAQGQYACWLPALHRCNKRDLLIKDLESIDLETIPVILERSLYIYTPESDDIADLIWLLNKGLNGLQTQDLYNAAYEAMLREAKARPQNMGELLNAPISGAQYRETMAAIINEVSIIKQGMLAVSEPNELAKQASLIELLFNDWQQRWGDLTSILIYLARGSMANTEFRRTYQQVIEQGWTENESQMTMQAEQLVSRLENQYESILGQIYESQVECSNNVNASLSNLKLVIERSNLPGLTSVIGYLDDCQTTSQEVLDKLAKEFVEDSKVPHITISNAAQYQAAMERLLIHHQKLQSYSRVRERMGYQLISALSLSLERVFLAIQTGVKGFVRSMESGFVLLLQQNNCIIIASLSAPEVLYDPSLHKSNQNLDAGTPVQVIFPGIAMANGTVIRHAMVEKI